jgi:23S rRNA (guanine2445-N2)-methyltransferase / 23S rRNA (guanine2069-N7)-methyltransferase
MLTHEDVAHAQAGAPHGLVATNPPYGERLTGSGDSEAIYRALGRSLSERFGGWQAVVLAARRAQIHATGLTIKRETTLYNGALPCAAAFYAVGDQARSGTLSPRAAARSSAAKRGERATEDEESPAPASVPGGQEVRTGRDGLLGGGAEQLANRLVKNRRRLSRQLRRENITCYRLYDADIPEFNIVVDVYGDWVHVQEYAAPGEIDPGKARRRLEDAVAVIGSVLQTPAERIVIKERRRQRGAEQYERHATRGGFLEVAEDELTYLVNLTDYLDTGLFIDQRLTRRLVRKLAGGRRFLNLFAYTGTMTVNALAGGSPLSASVDLSSTYLDWARRNLEANGFQPSSHQLIQADCLRWLAEAQGQYDLIWLDPPTFSNSKRMGSVTFDVQRDHADLIRMTARRLLAPGGILLFSTNRRGFKLHMDDLGDLAVKDMSRATLPFDCERAAARHHVYRLESSARE